MTNLDRMDEELPVSWWSFLKLKDWDRVKLRVLEWARARQHYENESWSFIEKYTKDSGDKIVKTDKPTEAPSEKLLWMFKIWNYETKQIQIREVTQKTIMQEMQILKQDEDYGDVTQYDLKVTRTWSTKNDTKYSLLPWQKSEVSDEIMEAYKNSEIDFNIEEYDDLNDPPL